MAGGKKGNRVIILDDEKNPIDSVESGGNRGLYVYDLSGGGAGGGDASAANQTTMIGLLTSIRDYVDQLENLVTPLAQDSSIDDVYNKLDDILDAVDTVESLLTTVKNQQTVDSGLESWLNQQLNAPLSLTTSIGDDVVITDLYVLTDGVSTKTIDTYLFFGGNELPVKEQKSFDTWIHIEFDAGLPLVGGSTEFKFTVSPDAGKQIIVALVVYVKRYG